mmetsp:Transcript_14816/g.43911  ORF Transcript_14816/g.43911 Transcript_14816/m.43911 type:complete len:212 (-) Transcript_14816:167-802(-)
MHPGSPSPHSGTATGAPSRRRRMPPWQRKRAPKPTPKRTMVGRRTRASKEPSPTCPQRLSREIGQRRLQIHGLSAASCSSFWKVAHHSSRRTTKTYEPGLCPSPSPVCAPVRTLSSAKTFLLRPRTSRASCSYKPRKLASPCTKSPRMASSRRLAWTSLRSTPVPRRPSTRVPMDLHQMRSGPGDSIHTFGPPSWNSTHTTREATTRRATT